MKDKLSIIRDLLIIAAIFLYFIAKVYVHFYYDKFGLRGQSLNIDYSTYLVYSYNVVYSKPFLFLVVISVAVYIVGRLLLRLFSSDKYPRIKWLRSWIDTNKLLLLGIVTLVIFPFL